MFIPGREKEYFERTALACLVSWFPRCPRAELALLARSPRVDIAPGDAVYTPSRSRQDVRLIVSGVAEETDQARGITRRLGVGSFASGSSPVLARSHVSVVSIPPRVYKEFMSRNGGARELP